ncbi:MAG: hypothetical protein ACPH9N_07955 [Alteromonas sp.]
MTYIPEITLYKLGATRSSRVRWILQEAELPFTSIQKGVAIFTSPDLLRIYPMGKVVKLEKQKNNLIASIREGVPADILRDELIRIDSELNRALLLVNANHGGDVIDLNIAAKYKSLVMGLTPDN